MRGIFVSGFFAYAALSCVIPIIPSYALSLGASQLMSAVAAGIFALSPAVAMTPFGILSEVYGRRLFILAGILTGAFASLLYLLSFNALLLILARLIHGFGAAMYIPAVNALVADRSSEDRRGETIGWLQTTLMLGFFAGPVAGGYTAEIYGAKGVFLLSLAFSITSLLFALSPVEKNTRGHLEYNFKFPTSMLPFYSLMFVGTAVTAALALFALPFYAPEIKITESQTGVIVSSLFLFSALSRVPAGVLSDRFGRKAGVIVGMIFGSLGLVMAATTNPIQLFIASSICGAGMGIVNTAVFAAASDCENRGFAIGLANTALNAGIFAGSAIAGYMATFLEFEKMMIYLAVISILFTPLVLLNSTQHLSLKKE